MLPGAMVHGGIRSRPQMVGGTSLPSAGTPTTLLLWEDHRGLDEPACEQGARIMMNMREIWRRLTG